MKIKKIIIKNKSFFKGPAPYGAKGSRSGFVILFAVTLSAILLSIALGVVNIALKEIKFGTSGKDTSDAFFAADTGAECALFNDKSTSNSFVPSGGTGNVQCLGGLISINKDPSFDIWSFTISGLGSGGQGCTKVTVDKTLVLMTNIISNGYNNGGGSCVQSSNTVERQIELNY